MTPSVIQIFVIFLFSLSKDNKMNEIVFVIVFEVFFVIVLFVIVLFKV